MFRSAQTISTVFVVSAVLLAPGTSGYAQQSTGQLLISSGFNPIAATPPANDGQLPPYTHDDKPPVKRGLGVRGAQLQPQPGGKPTGRALAVAPGAQPAAAAAAQPAASTNQPPPVDDKLAKSPYEHLATSWPAYEVHAFHETAIRLGGRDGGAPGVRAQYTAGFYGCFIFDPDGFKIEAVVREALPPRD